MTQHLRVVALVLALSLAACNAQDGSGPTTEPSTIKIEPGSAYLVQSDSVHLAVRLDAALRGGTVTWSSSNPLVADVNANGWVYARQTGIAFIRATVGTVTSAATVRVAAGGPCQRPISNPLPIC